MSVEEIDELARRVLAIVDDSKEEVEDDGTILFHQEPMVDHVLEQIGVRAFDIADIDAGLNVETIN